MKGSEKETKKERKKQKLLCVHKRQEEEKKIHIFFSFGLFKLSLQIVKVT